MTAWQQAAAKIRAGRRFLVAAHAHPDGDALGSMLASMHGLRALGKEVVAYDRDGAPARRQFQPGTERIVHRVPTEVPFDATLVHDCGDMKLLGDGWPPPAVTGPIIVLDHHVSGRPFGDLSLRDPAAAAVGVLVARLLRELGVAIDKPIAECLWCSLVEDTGWFRYSATDVETLRLAAACVEAGARPWDFALRAEESDPPERLRLLARVLDSLEIIGSTAILTLTRAMCDATGATADQADGFVGYARALAGIEVGVMLFEADEGVRVSLRSKGGVDVARVAERFGGGGHRAAAGCFIEGSLADARARVLAALAVPS